MERRATAARRLRQAARHALRSLARRVRELSAEADDLDAMPDREQQLAADRPGLLIIADKGFASRQFEAELAARGVELLARPATTNNPVRGRLYSSQCDS